VLERTGRHERLPAASIVITTRNRCADLRRAIESALAQTATVEVLVIDDASTDGTAAMVERDFPRVRLYSDQQPRGYIVQRNRAAELARAPVIISIDDDARFASTFTVEQTLKDFDDARVGAVAIPYADLVPRRVVRQSPPDSEQIWTTFRYIGTAHAIRRDLFLGLGGYRPAFQSRCEEADFSVRLLDAGYVTRLGRADLIHHVAAPRDDGNNMHMQARNDVLHAWGNAPLRFLPMSLLEITLRHLWVGLTLRRPLRVASGLARGYQGIAKGTLHRRPVRVATHRIDRQLRRHGPLPLSELAGRLPEPGLNGLL
jgi:glycosyltransferase involved in cell wall biosynthesis